MISIKIQLPFLNCAGGLGWVDWERFKASILSSELPYMPLELTQSRNNNWKHVCIVFNSHFSRYEHELGYHDSLILLTKTHGRFVSAHLTIINPQKNQTIIQHTSFNLRFSV